MGTSARDKRYAAARIIIDRNAVDVFFSKSDVEEFSRTIEFPLTSIVKQPNPAAPNDTRHLHGTSYLWKGLQQFSWRRRIDLACARDPGAMLEKQKMAKIYDAMRLAVRRDVVEFEASISIRACAQCEAREDLTVDHKWPPFISIVDDFIRGLVSLNLRDVEGLSGMIANPNLAEEWRIFHKRRARFQLLCRSCNSSKGANGELT